MAAVTRLEKAPLVEVMAELRWNTASDMFLTQAPPGMLFQIPDALAAEDEQFYERFGELVEAEGFRASEKLFPPNASPGPGQAAVRYRQRSNVPPILQVGPGVFTANGVPPVYTHWGDFRPVLRMGVRSVLSSRHENEQSQPCNVSVRYINAFGPDLWGQAGREELVAKLLGFRPGLPADALSAWGTPQHQALRYQVSQTLTDGTVISLEVGDGSSNGGETVIVMDLSAGRADIEPTEDALMECLEQVHGMLRGVFFAVVSPILDELEPREVEE